MPDEELTTDEKLDAVYAEFSDRYPGLIKGKGQHEDGVMIVDYRPAQLYFGDEDQVVDCPVQGIIESVLRERFWRTYLIKIPGFDESQSQIKDYCRILRMEMLAIMPSVVIFLGHHAANEFLGLEKSVEQYRGSRFVFKPGAHDSSPHMFVTYAPGFILSCGGHASDEYSSWVSDVLSILYPVLSMYKNQEEVEDAHAQGG